jgi:hypothetical protein
MVGGGVNPLTSKNRRRIMVNEKKLLKLLTKFGKIVSRLNKRREALSITEAELAFFAAEYKEATGLELPAPGKEFSIPAIRQGLQARSGMSTTSSANIQTSL